MSWEIEFREALSLFYNSIFNQDIKWVLTGSYRLYLSGLNISPSDIDIISNKTDIYVIENNLISYSFQKVNFSINNRIMSHFGILNINGVKIELIGDVKNFINDTWEEHLEWEKNISYFDVFDMKIPVLSLAYEYSIYKKLGNIKMCNLIEKFLM